MSEPEIYISVQEHQAMTRRAEWAEQRVRELREELFVWKRARDRWMSRAFTAEHAIGQATILIQPMKRVADRIDQISYGGPSKPLLAVRGEAEKARTAYDILLQAKMKSHVRDTLR